MCGKIRKKRKEGIDRIRRDIIERSFLVKNSYYNKKTERRRRREPDMSRKLIIDGNAVYEIDEECMLKQKLDGEKMGEDNTSSDYTAKINRRSDDKSERE
mgnify:CR=1 FL=1